jgi:hypothetical protein
MTGMWVAGRYSRQQGSGKTPQPLPLTARARSRFRRRSAPSDGTEGGNSVRSGLDQCINASPIVDQELVPRAHDPSDVRPGLLPEVLGCFGFPDTTLNTILCQSHALLIVMGQPIPPQQPGMFSIRSQSAPPGPSNSWSWSTAQSISFRLASNGMIEDDFRSARHACAMSKLTTSLENQ